jgi:hypothetical protein
MENATRPAEGPAGEPPDASPMDYEVLPPLRRSGPGIASFVLAVAAVGALVAVFAKIVGRPASDMLAYKLFALVFILPAVGMVLGVVSMFQRRRYRALPIAGLTINVLLCLFLLLVTIPSLLHEWRYI